MSERADQLTADLLDALDYGALGEVYCDEGGDAFWQAKAPVVRRCGGPWADAVRERLAPGGHSLYAGAGVAELPAIVAEIVDLGRTVQVANLRAAECEALQRGLLAIGGLQRVDIAPRDAAAVAAERTYDHLCVVSVLTDPETWPLLSDVTYGRIHPALLDPAILTAELGEAAALARALFGSLTHPGWITTTFEEAPWFLRLAADQGLEVQGDEQMLESPLVEDPIGFLAVDRQPSTRRS